MESNPQIDIQTIISRIVGAPVISSELVYEDDLEKGIEDPLSYIMEGLFDCCRLKLKIKKTFPREHFQEKIDQLNALLREQAMSDSTFFQIKIAAEGYSIFECVLEPRPVSDRQFSLEYLRNELKQIQTQLTERKKEASGYTREEASKQLLTKLRIYAGGNAEEGAARIHKIVMENTYCKITVPENFSFRELPYCGLEDKDVVREVKDPESKTKCLWLDEMKVRNTFNLPRRVSSGIIALLGITTIATLLVPAFNAWAQPGTHFASGTGFFVSQNGHIVTNEHVVHGCETVQIRGGVEPIEARVVKTDKENDLALLQANTIPQQIATLSTHPLGVQKGDKVMVIGYPLEHAISGQYLVKEAEIIDSVGPLNEPQWLQFSDSAQQGNSGGPLLDTSGNVVGVITGKAQVFSVDPVTQAKQKVKESDVAVSLPVLIRFLEMNAVYFNRSPYITYYMPERIEDMAKHYIVNIHCPQAGGEQAAY